MGGILESYDSTHEIAMKLNDVDTTKIFFCDLIHF